MRPNQQDLENSVRLRRQKSGGANKSRLTIALAVGIGIVVVSLVLANTYDFGSTSVPPQDGSRSPGSDLRSIVGSGVDNPDDSSLFPSGGSGGSTGSTAGGGSGAPNGRPGDTTGNAGSSGISDSSGSGSSGGDFGGAGGVASSGNSGNTGAAGSGSSSGYGDQTGDVAPGVAGSGAPGDEDTAIALSGSCTIHGRVTDDWGSPIVGVLVRAVTPDGIVMETVTDIRGRYALFDAIPAPDPNADQSTAPDSVDVGVFLSHRTGARSSFAIMNGDSVIGLTTSVSLSATSGQNGCEQNFDAWNIQDGMVATPVDTALWPDAALIYQYTLNAEELALSLGAELSKATTLQVQAWCDNPALGCDGSSAGAFFVAENELGEGSPPIIAMMPARSSANSAGIPDNREYHEYGHYFLWLQTGETFELPAQDRNHGGYYRNSSTRDSFVEGFAEFYSMMVSRVVDKDDRSEIYTIGADYDLEADRLPWEAEGWWEEFTVAGLLLDLVDSDVDYTARAAGPSGVNVVEVSVSAEPSGTIVLGKVVNTSPLVVRNTDVTVRYMNSAGELVGTQVTKVIPEIIAPSREGVFFAAPPAGVNVAGATATIGGIAKADDDGVALSLQQLISIVAAEGAEVSNIAELHEALTGDVESLTTAAGPVSVSQIDEVFISHGFFADLDGDKKYDPEVDGEVGKSSHPVIQVGGTFYPAFIPRSDPGAFDGSFVTIDTGDDSVDAVIQVSIPADGGSGSYAYITTLSGSERVELAVPSSDQDAEVTIITAGKDFKPVIAFRVDADNFHEKVEDGTISELQITPVELEPGVNLAPSGESESFTQINFIIGGVIAALLVVASLVAINRKWGRA